MQLTIVKSKTLFAFNNACWNFSYRCSWVFCIKTSIEITVESHGGTAGKDHAENNKNKSY